MLTLLSSGSNAHGQLANGSLDDSYIFQKCSFEAYPDNTLPGGTSGILDVATGANHTLVLLDSDKERQIWGCGDGRKGQLGLRYQRDSAESESTTTVFRKIELALDDCALGGYSFKFIAATWETTYIVLACEGKADVVISMGSDDYGDLGVGPSPSSKKAQQKDFHIVQFGHLTIPSTGRLLPSDLRVGAISAGQRHVILTLQIPSTSEEILVGWGSSRHGQLGPSTTPKPSLFISIPRIIPLLSPNDPVISSSLGIHHSVFLHRSGPLSCLGSDRKSQLLVVQAAQRVKGIGCTWNGSYLVVQGDDEGWSILSSGSNSHNQLGWGTVNNDSSSKRVAFPDNLNSKTTKIQIASGSEHVLALIRDTSQDIPVSEVWGWGWNEHGNLGVGNTEDVPTPVCIWPSDGRDDVRGIWAGCGTSWICVEDRE